MTRAFAVVLTLAACSGRAKPVEDGARPASPRAEVHAGNAAPTSPTSPQPASVPAGALGDVQVRVEWHDVPVAARTSPGRSACGTARAPSIAPTTTWGIPDVFVVISNVNPAHVDASVVLAPCALEPRVIVAASSLAVRSAVESPAQLALTRRGSIADLGTLADGSALPIQLPIAGHEVDVPLEPDSVYELSLGHETNAWILAAAHARAGITDPSGQLVVRDLPVGKYAVTAWLPPRAGQPAHVAHGSATIAAGALAEIALDLAAK